MSLKRPSYFFRMVFFVDRYRGHFLLSAMLKQLLAKPLMDSSVLYMLSATPSPLKLNTSKVWGALPSSGVKVIVSLPLPFITVSVALYWSPNACRPTMIGAVQLVTSRGTLLITIGSRKTVPSRIFLIVPFGLFHIWWRLNSFTLASSGVIV